ncbi:di-heme-cytochrome C peroxidase [Bradyrhizobium diazoefficiens]|uniref:di-heme-cytochrome C peroxidase n=1 Tax=Bradyrhizobium diazoefficiens TaxID=1355477 RepID=UPI0004B57962|nr:di-heme-cytochrome C peroxidase [Bradyrhizobium diazoefficiens]
MLRNLVLIAVTALAATNSSAQGIDPNPVYVDQGQSWTTAARTDFYSRDQGSRLIALSWLQALKQQNGQLFLADGLSRYGYLPNPESTDKLPVGFHASGPQGFQTVGMTCSACHTRQINVNGKAYRIDGGPALADFHAFLSDLDKAVGDVVANEASFAPFAAAVLQSPTPAAPDVAALRLRVDAWYRRYHTLMVGALPPTTWGIGRLDAVGMIFNRVSGLDIGPPPDFMIPENIKRADAPARYPFLWNAPLQDFTQWAGFAGNGSDLLGLARNVGEVLGVFATFEPKREGLIINFLNNNSANFDGLSELEKTVRKIGPPRWPWKVDPDLAGKGKLVFERHTAEGGCADCHGIVNGTQRFPFTKTWRTPIKVAGTDTRQYDILSRKAKSGVLNGVYIPLATSPLQEEDLALNILATSVIGSIAEHILTGGGASTNARVAAFPESGSPRSTDLSGVAQLPPTLQDLPLAFNTPNTFEASQLAKQQGTERAAPSPIPPRGAYEARVLQGIWAAAPYLHNGSVATLADLLKPSTQRAQQFSVGSDYDIDNIGLATTQSHSSEVRHLTDCTDVNSGNSRCGHEYGTALSDEDKRALLEFLKTL